MKRRAWHGIVWTLGQTLGARLVQTILFVVLARLLTPAAFGLVALAMVFVSLMQVFVEQGFSQAIIQREDLEPSHLDSAFWSSLAISGTLAAVGVACSGAVAKVLGQPDLAPVLRALCPMLILAGLSSTPEAILRREMAFRALAIRRVVATTVSAIAGVAAAAAGFGVWSLVVQTITQAAVGVVLLWVAVPWRPGTQVSWARFRELAAFGSNVVGSNVLNFVNRRGDDLLIGAVLGPRALGVYSVAYRLLLLLTDLVTRTIESVALPLFARLQGDLPRMKRGYLVATQVSATIASPVFILAAALSPIVIPLCFGAKWHAAVPVMEVLAFIGILHATLFFNTTVMIATGRPRAALLVTAMNATSNLIAFVAVVHWGVTAVAAAYVVRGYITSPVPILMVRRWIGFSLVDYVRRSGIPLLCALVMGGVVVGLRLSLSSAMPGVAALVVLVPVGLTIYGGLFRLVAPAYVLEIREWVDDAVPNRLRVSLTRLARRRQVVDV